MQSTILAIFLIIGSLAVAVRAAPLTADTNSVSDSDSIVQFPVQSSTLNIQVTCTDNGVLHQAGEEWVSTLHYKKLCLPSGLIQVSGCSSDGHDFPLSPQPTTIGQFQYWCCVNSQGSYNFQRIDTSNNNLGIGTIVRGADGQLQFIPQQQQFCN